MQNLLIIAAQQGQGFGGMISIGFMVLIFAIFYFLLIRPQQKKEKMRQRQIAAMTKGDKIITVGGLIAIVSEVKDDIVIAKIGTDIKIEILKSAIQQVTSK